MVKNIEYSHIDDFKLIQTLDLENIVFKCSVFVKQVFQFPKKQTESIF